MAAVDESVASALDGAFPDRTVDDVAEAGPSWNDGNRTVRVAFADGGTAFLKAATDGDGTRVTRERTVIEYAGPRCDVAVPTVLTTGTDGPVPYLATAPMSGDPFHVRWADWSTEERATGLERLGAALASIHDIEFEQHGNVVGGGADGLSLATGTWSEVLVERIDELQSVASSDRFDSLYDEVAAAVEADAADRLDRAPATLVHGDPAMPNVVWRGSGLGFLDWEIAHVGDPARELHRVEDAVAAQDLDADIEDRLLAALRDGYRRAAGSLPDGYEERAPVYDAVRFLGTAGFFDKQVEHVDQSEAEYAEYVEAEMERRLARIG